jgi:hypothetical protein
VLDTLQKFAHLEHLHPGYHPASRARVFMDKMTKTPFADHALDVIMAEDLAEDIP